MKSIRIVASAAVVALSTIGCGVAGNSSLDGAEVLSVKTRTVDDLSLTVRELETPVALQEQISDQVRDGLQIAPSELVDNPADDLDNAGVIIDKLINIGKKMWAVVEAGKPVMNVKFDFATALPQGVTSASQLAGFSDLKFKSFEYSATNLYGIEVFKVQYTVVYQFGGAYNGKGAYIATASVVPQDVSVMWGYDLSMNVDNVSVANLGTSDSPVAGMNLMAKIKVSTVIKASELNEVFAIRGDNGMLTRVH